MDRCFLILYILISAAGSINSEGNVPKPILKTSESMGIETQTTNIIGSSIESTQSASDTDIYYEKRSFLSTDAEFYNEYDVGNRTLKNCENSGWNKTYGGVNASELFEGNDENISIDISSTTLQPEPPPISTNNPPYEDQLTYLLTMPNLESILHLSTWPNLEAGSAATAFASKVNTSGRNETIEKLHQGIPWPVKKEAIVEGDIILGGLMMVHEREDSITCGPVMPQGGIQALEAMLFTLDQVNTSPMPLLPNITIGAHILDDCDKDTYGLEMAVDFIKGLTPGETRYNLEAGWLDDERAEQGTKRIIK